METSNFARPTSWKERKLKEFEQRKEKPSLLAVRCL